MKNKIYNTIIENKGAGKKMLAVLIDPDSVSDEKSLANTCKHCNLTKVDFILVGGSLITNGYFERCVSVIKQHTKIPVVLFPGNVMQISDDADAILFLSLISGRNPELLIGKHVLAAPMLKKSKLEIIPTGYILIDGGSITSVSYMSNTIPIPANKNSIAATTALAGEMLGMKIIYMDAGSGAKNHAPTAMIKEVRKNVSTPIFIGGGIRNASSAVALCKAGADVIVVGNAFEKDSSLIKKIADAVHFCK